MAHNSLTHNMLLLFLGLIQFTAALFSIYMYNNASRFYELEKKLISCERSDVFAFSITRWI